MAKERVGILNKYPLPLPVVFCNGGKYVQAWCPVVDVASQGKDIDEAKHNIEDALDMYFKDKDTPKPKLKSITSMSVSLTTIPVKVGGLKDGKASTTLCS